MNLSNRVFAIAFLLVSFFSITLLHAQEGGSPMLTDDSDTPEKGEWEVNTAFIYNGDNEIYTLEGPAFDINYGLHDNIQLTCELPWVKEKGEPLASKLDNITLGLKYRFFTQDSDGISASIYPQAIISFNAELVAPRRANVGFYIPVSVGKTFYGVGVVGQLGYERLADAAHWVYGVVLSREMGESLVLLAELHGEVERIEDGDPFLNLGNFVNVGAQIKLSETFGLLAAVGRSLTKSEFGHNFYGYAGLQLNF